MRWACSKVLVFLPVVNNNLHVMLSKLMALTPPVDYTIMNIYDLSNHLPVAADIEYTLFLEKLVFDLYHSFEGANFYAKGDFMFLRPFQSICYTNME